MPTSGLIIASEWEHDPAYEQAVGLVTESLKARQLLPLVGAGFSCDPPACLPLAAPLVGGLQNVLQEAADFSLQCMSCSPESVTTAYTFFRNARLERLLDAMIFGYGPQALSYLDVLNGAIWNPNHGFFAEAARFGLLRACVTLNFDLLIESATQRFGRCVTECPLIGREFQCGDGPEVLRIIKPHGSFAPGGHASRPYDFLSAAISQVGTQPARANRKRLDDLTENSPTLLVAGYSDDDWDIFPMLQHLGQRFGRIVWLEYASDADRAAETIRCALADEPPKEGEGFQRRVIPWLKGARSDSVVLVCRASSFFREVSQRCGLEWHGNEGATGENRDINTGMFAMKHDLSDEQSLRTMLSLAALVQHTGVFSRQLLKRLERVPLVRSSADLAWRVEHLLAHTEHTAGHLRRATMHMSRAIRLKSSTADREHLANDLVWLGYEHLCLAKRPERRSDQPDDQSSRPRRFSDRTRRDAIIRWALEIPFEVARGLWLLARGGFSWSGRERERRTRRASVVYYLADLLHSWGNLLMLAGGRRVRKVRLYFGLPLALYWLASRIDPEWMDSGYYWMRRLEAGLLFRWGLPSGTRRGVMQRLLEIRVMHNLIQENVQVGNTYAYEALIVFVEDNNRRRSVELLDRAESEWRTSGGSISSGHRRVTLFRRFVHQITWSEAANAMGL